MVKSVVKSFLPNIKTVEKRENVRKTEILRAFDGRLMRRSHAPKPRALPTALHSENIKFKIANHKNCGRPLAVRKVSQRNFATCVSLRTKSATSNTCMRQTHHTLYIISHLLCYVKIYSTKSSLNLPIRLLFKRRVTPH